MGRRIAYFRKTRKISASELAERAGAGLTRSVIANLENGRKADLTVQQLFAISDVLNAPASSLVGAGDRIRAALAAFQDARDKYTVAMQDYLDSMAELAYEADRSDEAEKYPNLDMIWDGSTPTRLSMAQNMSDAWRDELARPEVAEGRYVKKLMSVLEEDVKKFNTP